MKRKKLLLITAIAAAALLAAGCQESNTATFPGEEETYSAEVANLGASNRFAGVVCASGETEIKKDEDRDIAKVKVAPGDDVKKDQVLFVYDSEQAQLNYDKAALELEQLNLTLQQYTEQKASLEKEKNQADASEQLSYSIEIQEADTNIRETSYNIKLKEDEVAKLKKGLKKLKVKSPIDGKVQSINEDGAVGADGSTLPYMVIMNTGTYRVKAYINELNAMELYEGAPVTVRSRVDDSTWTGKVASVEFNNPSSEQQDYDMEGSSDTTTSSKYPFYVELDNADGLILGQHVFVEVDIEFTVPSPSEEDEEPDVEGDGSEDFGEDIEEDFVDDEALSDEEWDEDAALPEGEEWAVDDMGIPGQNADIPGQPELNGIDVQEAEGEE